MKFWFGVTGAPSNTVPVQIHAPHNDLGSVIPKVIDFLIYAAGALAFIFVLVGAFQYVISGGNPDATRKAKDTILYALIGVAVSAAAYAIVHYVLGKL